MSIDEAAAGKCSSCGGRGRCTTGSMSPEALRAGGATCQSCDGTGWPTIREATPAEARQALWCLTCNDVFPSRCVACGHAMEVGAIQCRRTMVTARGLAGPRTHMVRDHVHVECWKQATP